MHSRGRRWPAGLGGALAVVLLLFGGAPIGQADEPLRPRISASDPLNGGFLVVNMHGLLFHERDFDLREDVAYARWLGTGIVRVFATDSNGYRQWDGATVGAHIAELAPLLRANRIQLIVALVNNHRAVPGESSTGWIDNYFQLLLPFYTTTWRGQYLNFMRGLISTVQARGALDVIYAWELGNELHTPAQPAALIPFVTQAVQEVRALDSVTPILPGTMGANHLEPDNPRSPIARWLYCEAPIDAYTLHAYDWVSPQRQGDMAIQWDLENIIPEPCPSGRKLPVIVEELGTSRALAGVYGYDDEQSRLQQELRQIQFVRSYPQVVGFGVWNGESPRLIDKTFHDSRRGLTSYGPRAEGGGSCYDPMPETRPGVRCQLEQALRAVRFVRVDGLSEWLPGPNADPTAYALVGGIDPVDDGDAIRGLPLTGWLGGEPTDVQGINLFLGGPGSGGALLAQGRLQPTEDGTSMRFALDVLPNQIPTGTTSLTVAAQTVEHGTWLATLRVVSPMLGEVAVAARPTPAVAPVALSVPAPAPLEIRSPQPGDQVSRSFILEGSAFSPGAIQRVDVFLEPGRDAGGRLVGSAEADQLSGAVFRVVTTLPVGGHTLDVHARATSGQELVARVAVVVN
jgi:hypothetical protein